MAVRQPRYSKEEFARRGETYENQVCSQVEEGNHGEFVAIDIETGAFEVADEILTATNRLFERLPDAQPWIVRIGHRAVHRFSARSLKTCMMQGVVNLNCEATIPLVVSNENRQTQLIDAVIDTGFLSLPREVIVLLNLPWTGIDGVVSKIIGSSSTGTFDQSGLSPLKSCCFLFALPLGLFADFP